MCDVIDFVAPVKAKIKNISAVRGALRQGARYLPAIHHPAATIVMNHLPNSIRDCIKFNDDRSFRNYYTVACLMAIFDVECNGRSVGRALRILKSTVGDATINRKFINLLKSNPANRGKILKGIVDLLRSKNVGIDWFKLLKDLEQLDDCDQKIQLRWEADFAS